jgi:hypothetical protein
MSKFEICRCNVSSKTVDGIIYFISRLLGLTLILCDGRIPTLLKLY